MARAPATDAAGAESREDTGARDVVPFEGTPREKDAETTAPKAANSQPPRQDRTQKPKGGSLAPGETAFGDHIPAFLLRPAKVA